MDIAAKKSNKKTSSVQLGVLVSELEANLDLARGAPQFGEDKSKCDFKWNEVANKINALGPQIRTVVEWKKIWADLKSRTKRKLADNARNLNGTGGGPFCHTPLTETERTIDRILSMSKAAAPAGQVFGVSFS
ncbi:myb-related transcription factor, partner of profilin-like [Eurosta solidaginis]|uniref:myb-related transcription factor, partner of profilin-like n=1 Tax=Eurosta solidaginis TaxID=178769 RepID=UPI003530A8C4